MTYQSRVLAGILLAVVLAGGLGVAVAQIFPSTPVSVTAVSTATSTLSSTTFAATTSSITTITTTAVSTVTSTVAIPTTTTTTATSTSTATSVETVSSLSSATSVTSTATESSPTTCGSLEYCGAFAAESPALKAANSSSGYSALTFTLINAGNLNLTDIQIALNGQHVATVAGVGPAQTVTYFVQLPQNLISPGQSYQVEVTSSTVYGAGPTVAFSVTAAQ